MKNTIKLFGVLLVVFGVFVALGSVSASTADLLQPAGATTSFESIRVGVAGEGGVTFFNGSVLNEDGPYVIADDSRIDGEIWRMEKGGDNPLKISDHIIPTATNTNNFGTSSKRWASIYTQDGNFSDDLVVGDALSVSGNSSFAGEINQSRNQGGAMKAMVYCRGDGGQYRQWTHDGSTITCSRNSTGNYVVSFGFKVNDRFWSGTPAGINQTAIGATSSISFDKNLWIETTSSVDGTVKDTSFMLTVY